MRRRSRFQIRGDACRDRPSCVASCDLLQVGSGDLNHLAIVEADQRDAIPDRPDDARAVTFMTDPQTYGEL